MTPIETSSVIFACVFGGALVGLWLRTILPEHHLDAETRDLVKLGVGLIGTMSALVLGLLVASAKGTYDTRSSELTQMAADSIVVDRMLAHYGPESAQVRLMLRAGMTHLIGQVWQPTGYGGIDASTSREVIFDRVQELTPHNDIQRALQTQAEATLIQLGQTRWLLFEQNGSALSTPFLVVVVFWLTILFVSFGLFAPRNTTAFITLLVTAMSVAGALFLILELDRPFSGLMQISDAPLRSALLVLGR